MEALYSRRYIGTDIFASVWTAIVSCVKGVPPNVAMLSATLIASDQLERVCYAMELEPRFVDVGVKRYIEYKESSEEVYLLRDGEKKSWEDVVSPLLEKPH